MKLSKKFGKLGLAIAGFLLSSCAEQAAEKSQSAMNSNAAGIVFKGGDVYTVEESQPWAKGVAV